MKVAVGGDGARSAIVGGEGGSGGGDGEGGGGEREAGGAPRRFESAFVKHSTLIRTSRPVRKVHRFRPLTKQTDFRSASAARDRLLLVSTAKRNDG